MCNEVAASAPLKRHKPRGQDSSRPRDKWRKCAESKRLLGETGMECLKGFLDEKIVVMPQAGNDNLPSIHVTPAEIIRYTLASFASKGCSRRPPPYLFAEVYGSVAHRVVCTDNEIENLPNPPTDFDVRFYIPKFYGCDLSCFDICRNIIEELLAMKLRLILQAEDASTCMISLVRTKYFQKQVVVGNSFSLLSIGDFNSGKAIDIEFWKNLDGGRKYFDDANSFVIPLNLEQLAGVMPVCAFTMTDSFQRALDLAATKTLTVEEPLNVLNGLTLYAHSLCHKILLPPDVKHEENYGSIFADSFMDTCFLLQSRFDDPLRYVKSFIRSHYTGAPLCALVTLTQMIVEIFHYGTQEFTERAVEQNIVALLSNFLAELLYTVVSTMECSARSLDVILTLTKFLKNPSCFNEDGTDRILALRGEDGRTMRLMKKCGDLRVGEGFGEQVAERLRRFLSESMDSWRNLALLMMCEVLDENIDVSAKGQLISKQDRESMLPFVDLLDQCLQPSKGEQEDSLLYDTDNEDTLSLSSRGDQDPVGVSSGVANRHELMELLGFLCQALDVRPKRDADGHSDDLQGSTEDDHDSGSSTLDSVSESSWDEPDAILSMMQPDGGRDEHYKSSASEFFINKDIDMLNIKYIDELVLGQELEPELVGLSRSEAKELPGRSKQRARTPYMALKRLFVLVADRSKKDECPLKSVQAIKQSRNCASDAGNRKTLLASWQPPSPTPLSPLRNSVKHCKIFPTPRLSCFLRGRIQQAG
eukprot:755952-Hanusia_phi.AAC.4